MSSRRYRHHSPPWRTRDQRWSPHRSSRAPNHRKWDGKGINQHEAVSMRSGCSSHSDGGGSYKNKMTDFDRESRTVGTSLTCCDSLGHHVCRQRGPRTERSSSEREPSPHLKGERSPSCSMAGVHRETMKRPLEKEVIPVSLKRAKMKQGSDHASSSSVVSTESPSDDLSFEESTCSWADHGRVGTSQLGTQLGQRLEERRGQGRAPGCTYTSFLPKRFYQWRKAPGGREKVLCATAALRELHCAFTDKLLAPRGIPASCSFLTQIKNLQTLVSWDSVGNHGDEELEELKNVEVTEGELPMEGGGEGEEELPLEGDGEGERRPQGTNSSVRDKEVQEISDMELTEAPLEREAVENMKPSFSVKSRIHDALLCNFPSKNHTSFWRQHAFGRSCIADMHVRYHHYHIEIVPQINFKSSRPTALAAADRREYLFEGYSVASCVPLDKVPVCYFQRYGHEYALHLKPEPLPKGFTICDALLLEEYLSVSLCELYDWAKSLRSFNTELIFLPRFVRHMKENMSREVLSLCEVLDCLLQAYQPLIQPQDSTCKKTKNLGQDAHGLLVTHSGKSPACIRVDRLEPGKDGDRIVHFSSLSSGRRQADDDRQALYSEIHQRKLSRGKLGRSDHFEMKALRYKLQAAHRLNRELLLELPAKGFYSTGLYTDVVQHVLVLPTLAHHVLFHDSLHPLEEQLQYHFKDRQLLQCALTHSSSITSLGTTESHIRTTASNCGTRRLHQHTGSSYTTPQRGMTTMLSNMEPLEGDSGGTKMDRIKHNEQLEFLGDAILEFLCSLHLYHIFPTSTDGELTVYRRALVKNKHLATLAAKLRLGEHMLVGEEGRDVSYHASTDCFEALLAALCLDGGLPEAQKMLARLVFPERDLYHVWMNYSLDPLQQQYPGGDRHMIEQSEALQRLVALEQSIGVQFTHIRLLARAFTHPSVGYTNLTMGSYQRMEFLGDAVLQFLASRYVYSHFPSHREGHLSVLRTALVHNKQLAKLSRQLGFDSYIMTSKTEPRSQALLLSRVLHAVSSQELDSGKAWEPATYPLWLLCEQEVKLSDKVLADVVESFLAALLLDKGLEFAQKFLEVCLFPKLADLLKNSQLVDANTRLHQALARTCRREGTAIEMPQYRVLSATGPSGRQQFRIGVYFRGKRLGVGTGSSTREARMKAAEAALQNVPKSGIRTR